MHIRRSVGGREIRAVVMGITFILPETTNKNKGSSLEYSSPGGRSGIKSKTTSLLLSTQPLVPMKGGEGVL
jgi:hypothetical protein